MADKMNEKKVGKGNPPKDGQFNPGQSGNPKGRPKKRQNMRTIVHCIAHKKHLVTEYGHPTHKTTLQLLVHTLQKRALSGCLESSKYLGLLRKRYQADPSQRRTSGIAVPPVLEPDEFEVVMEAHRARTEWVQANRE